MRPKLLTKRPAKRSADPDDSAEQTGDLAVVQAERDEALAERDAAVAECADLARQLAKATEAMETAGSEAADGLIRAALSEAQTIRAEAELTAAQIIELAQERASVVHRNAEAEFRERIRRIADDGEPVTDLVPDVADDDQSDATFDLTHVVPGDPTGSNDYKGEERVPLPPPPPPPAPPAETPRAPTTKSFESLWQAAASVDDADLERFFSEEVERTEQRALFES